MNAEIISVGTELLLGNIVNTDARDLAVTMSELGINVFGQTVVGDNRQRLTEAVQIARQRAAPAGSAPPATTSQSRLSAPRSA